jgi:hypothetical protein
MGKKSRSGPGIRDEHPGSYFRDLEAIFWAKNTNSLRGSGSGIRYLLPLDTGYGIRDGFGFGIRNTAVDPKMTFQRFPFLSPDLMSPNPERRLVSLICLLELLCTTRDFFGNSEHKSSAFNSTFFSNLRSGSYSQSTSAKANLWLIMVPDQLVWPLLQLHFRT